MLNNKEIRAWAKEQGIEVGKRGRIDRGVKVAFLKAHPREVRALAADTSIELPKRGRLSAAQVDSVLKIVKF
jgi:hypothetical protein